MRAWIALAIILFLNVVILLFIIDTAYGADGMECAVMVKQIRQIADDDADAFDVDHLEETGTIKYMCDMSKFTVMDWDWIEWGVRLNRLCEQYRKECRGK